MYLGLWDFWARLLSLSESLDKSINQAKCKIARRRVAVKKYETVYAFALPVQGCEIYVVSFR